MSIQSPICVLTENQAKKVKEIRINLTNEDVSMMNGKLLKVYEFMTTMANGAYVKLNIDGCELDVYLTADTGLFDPFSDDAPQQLPEGMNLVLTASIRDNCDRCVFERKSSEEVGIRPAELEYPDGGKMEKVLVGEVVKIEEDGELVIKSDKVMATFDPDDSIDVEVGETRIPSFC